MTGVTEQNCPYPWEWVMVTADGAVRPCCYGNVVGNVHQNSLQDIWNSRAMLELRYFVEHHRLHSICQGAACIYAQSKAQQPLTKHEVADCRYVFADVNLTNLSENLEVSGKVVNAGASEWFLVDNAGTRRVSVGARAINLVNARVFLELRSAMPGDVFFPGESAPFKFRVKRCPGAILSIDVCNEGAFWFKDRGQKPLEIAL